MSLAHGPSCCAANCAVALPMVAEPIIATLPNTPPVETGKAATPFESDWMLACDWARITGIADCEIPASPAQMIGSFVGTRPTRLRKNTPAATTGCGGVAESTTQNTTGWKLCPGEVICKIPETG